MSILDALQNTLPRYKISYSEFMYLGSIMFPLANYEKDLALSKFGITKEGDKVIVSPEISRKFAQLLKGEEAISGEELTALATKLKEIYPKGKKSNTQIYWAEGVALIEARLKLFFKKFGYHKPEEIIDATQRYVDSFNGNYSYMRVLKYFIFKDVKGAEGVEKSSELLSYIENKNETNSPDYFDIVELC